MPNFLKHNACFSSYHENETVSEESEIAGTGKISVIIPVFNAAPYIGEAVESALAQPETGEVLLIEDGSFDRSLSICRNLAAKSKLVKLLRHPGDKNLGPGASRNLGLSQSCCEFISFLDADDFFYPGRFKQSFKMLLANQSIDGVYETVGSVFENGDLANKWHEGRKSLITALRIIVSPEALFDFLLVGDCGHFHGNGLLVRRNFFQRCGLFHTGLTLCQDTHMWIKMAAIGRLAPGNPTRLVAARRVHQHNRISKATPEDIFHIRREMWRSLVTWGSICGLSPNRMALLNYMDYMHREYRGNPAKVYSKYNYIKNLMGFGFAGNPVPAAIVLLELLRVLAWRL